MLNDLKNNKIMIIKAIKVIQPLGEFYIAKIKARDLLKISTSQVARYDKDGNIIGHQRPINPDRLKAIAKFIQSEEMSFPSSIIIAANVNAYGIIYDEEDNRWNIKPTNIPDIYELDVPERCISALIIDGQHRLKAFEENSLDDSFRDIELVCSIFFDLPGAYQAYLFATINGNQKRVDKSLALELFGINLENEPQEIWSPEKLAVYITRKFNFTKGSPLEGKIRLAPLTDGETDKSKWLLSTAAMVDGITKLISSNPQRDRDELTRKRKFYENKTRTVLKDLSDKSVLRDLYIENRDDEIYSILFNYFSSINKILWSNAEQNSIINKTIGISALYDVLKSLLEKDKSISDFDECIEKLVCIPYTDNYFSLSGKGKTRLKRVMKYHIGLITQQELKEEDMEHLQK